MSTSPELIPTTPLDEPASQVLDQLVRCTFAITDLAADVTVIARGDAYVAQCARLRECASAYEILVAYAELLTGADIRVVLPGHRLFDDRHLYVAVQLVARVLEATPPRDALASLTRYVDDFGDDAVRTVRQLMKVLTRNASLFTHLRMGAPNPGQLASNPSADALARVEEFYSVWGPRHLNAVTYAMVGYEGEPPYSDYLARKLPTYCDDLTPDLLALGASLATTWTMTLDALVDCLLELAPVPDAS